MKHKNTKMMKNILLKRCLVLTTTLLCVVIGAMAQRSYTFNAVALNVDGLPEKISVVTVNKGAPGAEGATLMGNAIAKQNWGIVGLSEDFNFHSELTASLTNYYHIGTHGGAVTGINNNTDGLGFLCAKPLMSFVQVDKVPWNVNEGDLLGMLSEDNGADELINKGFRLFTVTISSGVELDVYVLHMDAASRTADILARESQLAQLAAYIKGTNNKRPILIIGDTNCRYTREHLQTGFIDVINADSRFTIKDAWVEKVWNGVYPTYGADAMMWYNAPYNNNTGEVVDKIFYINNTESSLTIEANSYLHNTSFGVSDHYPVIVNFTITDPNGTPPTADDFTVDAESSDETPPTFEGNQVVNNTTYFIKNVSTGLYLKSGADYGTRAIEGSAGMPVTFKASGNKWKLYTSSSVGILAQAEPYMDGTPGEWTVELADATLNQYFIKCSAGTLSSTDNAFKKVNCVAHNANDDRQKWLLLTEDQMRQEMLKGTAIYPYDVTPLLKAADFDRMDDEFTGAYASWTGADENTIGGIWWQGDAKYNGCAAIVNTTKSSALQQTISNMPAGYYRISFEGFYRSVKSSSDQTLSATVTVGGLTFNLARNTLTTISTDRLIPGEVFRDNDEYAQQGTFQLTAAGDITITVTNPSTTGNNWVCIDNIKLIYCKDGFGDPYEEYRRMVADKINSTYEKVLLLNEAGQAAYDISTVMYRYNNNMITTAAEAKALCDMVDEAYANAYAAHLAALEADTANGLKVHFTFEDLKSEVGDYTGTLHNNAALTTLGDLPVLSLGSSNGYFDMSASVGNVIAVLDNFTISTNVYIPTTTSLSENGNFIYTFANSTNTAIDANGCVFFRAGVSNTRYAISTTHWGTETGLNISKSPFTDGDWHTITYRQSNNNGEIYIDGQLVVSGAIPINPKTLGATPYNFLGRSCYEGDAYLKDAMYNDFRIYKGAVDDATLTEFTANLDALNTALYKVQIAALMDKITLDDVLYNNVELPTAGENGITITWSTSNASAVSVTGQVVRPAYGQPDANVTLTATFTKGSVSEQKTFAVTIPAWEMDDNASVQADLEAIVLKGRLDNLMNNLYLPTASLQGSTITWQSSAPEYLDTNGELLQQHPDKKYSVVLTATATKGTATATRTFNICLAVKLPLKYYLFAYFNGNAQSQEQICFAISKDGYNYTPLNKGNPIINSSDIANKQAVRDPHILRGEDGYFYMVVTDMRSDDGWSSNDGLVLLRSDDMVTWTHTAIDFPTRWPERFDRDALTQVWAPQTIYDPEEDKYMVYYAIGESGKNYITYYSYANEDFTDLTEPQVLYNHSGNNTIDADIVYYKGQYHMFFKTEGQGNGIQKATAKTLRGEWTPGNQYLQQTTVAVEGSGVFRLIDSDTWILMYDCYTSGMYEYCTSTDLTNFTYKCNSANTDIFTPRHGTTITITSEEACRLLKKWPTGTDFDNIPLELYDTSDKAPRGVDGDYTEVTMHRTLKAKTTDGKAAWNSFVVPFDISSTTLGEEWEVKELILSELDGDMLTLTFGDVKDGIKAGVPYMVRNTSMKENLSNFTMENVNVNTELRPTTIGDVTFTGVYHYDYIPKEVFFINDNIFYQVKEDNKNKSKGYRAYIELSDNVSANVRSLSFRTDDDDNNNDDIPVVPATGGATVVAIYNTNGMRIDNLHDGINILQMSDGTTMKVVIK